MSSAQPHGSSAILLQISFDNNQLKLQQAINGVADYYCANQTLPASGGPIPAKDALNVTYHVSIFRAL
jgi:hypothetical protein